MISVPGMTSRKINLALTAVLSVVLTAGCGAAVKKSPMNTRAAEEAFIAGMSVKPDVSSLSFWQGEDGSFWAFSPDTQAGSVIIYDASKKAELKRFGKPGKDKGQFDRPVDTVVVDNLLFVLEEGNSRVQVFHLPDLESFGFIGEDRLSNPKHLALYRIEHGAFYMYVADSKKSGDATISHILRYSVSRAVNTIHSAYQVTFGIPSQGGRTPEIVDLAVDTAAKQVDATVMNNGAKSVSVFALNGDIVGTK